MYLISPIQPITFFNNNECIWICSSLSAFCMWSYHCRCIGQSGWKVHSSSAVRQFWVASSPIRSEFFVSKVLKFFSSLLKFFSSFLIEWFWRSFYGTWVLVISYRGRNFGFNSQRSGVKNEEWWVKIFKSNIDISLLHSKNLLRLNWMWPYTQCIFVLWPSASIVMLL